MISKLTRTNSEMIQYVHDIKIINIKHDAIFETLNVGNILRTKSFTQRNTATKGPRITALTKQNTRK